MSRIAPYRFDFMIKKLREFFSSQRGFVETHPQSHLDIMTACEDVKNMGIFNFSSRRYPLRQTNQMVLEHEMLRDPSPPGYFCVTTSYRDEKNPIEGRHKRVFPMFEFEMHGGINELIRLEEDLLDHLGFEEHSLFGMYPGGTYEDVLEKLGYVYAHDISAEDELRIQRMCGNVFFLQDFPEYTQPFWNMARNSRTQTAKKVDVILCGQETIGSAERCTDPEAMRERFMTISDGEYSGRLFEEFGEKRVLTELDEFLSQNFFPRSGGGIGLTRLERACEICRLLE